MNISHELRAAAAPAAAGDQIIHISDSATVDEGMRDKAREFRESGGEIYIPESRNS